MAKKQRTYTIKFECNNCFKKFKRVFKFGQEVIIGPGVWHYHSLICPYCVNGDNDKRVQCPRCGSLDIRKIREGEQVEKQLNLLGPSPDEGIYKPVEQSVSTGTYFPPPKNVTIS